MKPRMIFCVFFSLLTIPGAVFSGETADMWTDLYSQARTVQQKYEIMLTIVEMNDPDLTPMMIEALDDLNHQLMSADGKEQTVQNNLKMLIVKKLGDVRASEASDEIFRVVREASDPHVREEALIALGKIGAEDYALNIALILRSLNVYRGEDIVSEEALANGCIVALEKLRDPVGYLPVFYASLAGYSRRVTESAQRALSTMVDDPSEMLSGLIMTESSFDLKLHALQASAGSGAPARRTFDVATQALNEGLINKPASQDEETTLREIRRRALEMIIESGEKSDKPVPLIEQIFYLSNDDDSEKVFAIEALKSIGTQEATEVLVRYLAYQNDRQATGVTPRDNRIVISTIRALGTLNSTDGHRELLRAKFIGYPAVVGREVDRVLKSAK